MTTAAGPSAVSSEERPVLEALRRSAVYRLLGAALGYPLPERVAAVAALAERAATGAGESGESLARLARAAREGDPAVLCQEYVFLFDRAPRCPPYEGAWGDAPQLAGKSALLADIAGFYAAFGLVPSETQPDMEDHIAVECEFMSALGLKEAWALGENRPEALDITRKARAAFLCDHLGRWAEAFAAALREATPLPYYQALAAALEDWVRIETGAPGITPARVVGRTGYDPLQEAPTFTCPMAEPEAGPV